MGMDVLPVNGRSIVNFYAEATRIEDCVASGTSERMEKERCPNSVWLSSNGVED